MKQIKSNTVCLKIKYGLLKVHASSSYFNYYILPGGGRADEQDNTLLCMFYLNETQSVNHSKMSYLKVDTDADSR